MFISAAFLKYNKEHPEDTIGDRSRYINRTYLFLGNYTATFDYCNDMAKSKKKYDVLTNNCGQVSWIAMSQSNHAFSGKPGVIPNVIYNRLPIKYATIVSPKFSSWYASRNLARSYVVRLWADVKLLTVRCYLLWRAKK